MTTRALRIPSCLVMIVVGSSLCHAQSTRIEETDKSITYSGTWYTNGGSLNSGGGAALTNALGATAVVSFTGTGITWLGVLDPYAGFATVYLDGTKNIVDSYGSTTLYQQPLFTVRGLTNGPHTLSIQVNHSRDVNGAGSWVWIDAFDIENGSSLAGGVSAGAGRVEQNNAALNYNGVWFPNSSGFLSGGSAVLAIDAGSRATVTFNGTGVTWIGYRDQYSGIARVYVDGNLTATVDTYMSPSQAQVASYTASGLPSGTHTFTIEVTGTHSAASTGSWVWVDAFDVVGSGGSTGGGLGGTGGGTPTGTNLSQGKTASQSSSYPGTTTGAQSAVDGSTDGGFYDGSVSHTNQDNNSWWQVDLGASSPIGSIVIWNRTDCCSARLSDYWVFVSDSPFSPMDTPASLQSRGGTWNSHQTTAPSPSTSIPVGVSGRYVRVQLSGTEYLSLAEVQVLR